MKPLRLLPLLLFVLSSPAFGTFALTKFKAYGIKIDSPVKQRAVQYASLSITAANTDTALDIGSDSGTFWTAAKANATYGSMATNALARIKEITGRVAALKYVGGIEGYSREGADYTYHVYTSGAASGGSATETMTVTGLAATDTVLAITPNTVGAGTFRWYEKFTSGTASGGSATETMVVTGLAAADTVIAVTQSTKGANNTAVTGWSGLALNALDVDWTADPGAGAIVEVLVQRTADLAPVAWSGLAANAIDIVWPADPGAGAKVDVLVRRAASGASSIFSQSVTDYRPNITFVSGGAPTAYTVVLSWELEPEKYPVFVDYGS